MYFRTIIIIFLLPFLLSCRGKKVTSASKSLQKENYEGVKEYTNFKKLEPIFNKKNDTVYLLNFWATTCPPCVKEMPLFEQLALDFKKAKFEILLISTDRKKDKESRLLPFLQKHQLQIPTVWLTDPNATKWTEAVNPKWYGALPYTIIYKNEERKYFFGSFENYAQLKSEIEHFF